MFNSLGDNLHMGILAQGLGFVKCGILSAESDIDRLSEGVGMTTPRIQSELPCFQQLNRMVVHNSIQFFEVGCQLAVDIRSLEEDSDFCWIGFFITIFCSRKPTERVRRASLAVG